MADLLVKLYDLPYVSQMELLAQKGIRIHRAMTPNQHQVLHFVRTHFSENWASEAQAAFAQHPVTCFIASVGTQVIGFACYEATMKNYFGPIGVDERYRGTGIGAELLYQCLKGLAELGYAYAIIGGAGDSVYPFYHKNAGAVRIDGSEPGIYQNLLK